MPKGLMPLLLSAAAGVLLVTAGYAKPPTNTRSTGPGTQWPYFGGTEAFDRYSPLSQINTSNFKNLTVQWTRPSVDKSIRDAYPDVSPSNYLKSTPVMIDGVLYAADGVGLVEAFDARTGATIWVQKPFTPTLKEAAGTSTRGVSMWRENGEARIIAVRGEYLYALIRLSTSRIHLLSGCLFQRSDDGFPGEYGRLSFHRQSGSKLCPPSCSHPMRAG